MKQIAKIFTALIIIILPFILFPSKGFAVDYSIVDVKIDAYLQENGDVKVNESLTYHFDSKFNGITREIIPKEGTSIKNLQATENGSKLVIEQDGYLYKIHRKGKDETITVNIAYLIENGVDKYLDIGEFYWPFFDKRNESTYENLTITIHPPKETEEVIAFGYDEAFQTENIISKGIVMFELGKVPDGKNGDIRVAYDAALFPAAPLTESVNMKDNILAAKEELINKAEQRAERKENLSTIAAMFTSVFSAILLFVFAFVILKERAKRNGVIRELSGQDIVPEEIMSLPATILFVNGYTPPSSLMPAAFLDFIRKGYIKKADKTHFSRNHEAKPVHDHEKKLLQFLFEIVGSKETFSFNHLSSFTKKKRNHEKYHSNVQEWMELVRKEIKDSNLYENTGKLRLLIGLSSILLLPFLVALPIYGVFHWFAAILVLFITVLLFAILYKPKNWNGLKLTYSWKKWNDYLNELDESHLKKLKEDHLVRLYIYGLGTNNKNVIKKNEKLMESFQLSSSSVSSDLIFMNGVLAATTFNSADKTAQSSISSSSPASFSGGGTGGGGGGSGAF